VRVDLVRLHETWMELIFPRQRGAADTVLGKYTPDSLVGMAGYRGWGLLGLLVVAALYPFAVVGFATRYYAAKANTAATRLGLAGVVVLTALAWGGLTVLARVRFDAGGFRAVAAAGVVATISAALSVVFARVDGRPVTVLLAYPFAVTAVFLPPVVAAFYSPTLADLVFPGSESLAATALDNAGAVGTYLRENFELTGVGYVAMWFGISVPVGWVLGATATLANAVRPSGSPAPESAD
jgi:hypothetical protein